MIARLDSLSLHCHTGHDGTTAIPKQRNNKYTVTKAHDSRHSLPHTDVPTSALECFTKVVPLEAQHQRRSSKMTK